MSQVETTGARLEFKKGRLTKAITGYCTAEEEEGFPAVLLKLERDL